MEEWLKSDPEFRALVEEARVTGQIARLVYDERHAAELTQQQLADRVGTTQSVVARLEDDDYDRHSLAMLRRIAAAVGHHLVVSFDPRPAKRGRSAVIPGAFPGDPALCAVIDDEDGNLRLAHLIRGTRTRVRLTQQELADRARTTQPVIARLENGVYRGHSLGMLRRIAIALGCDLGLRFAPHASGAEMRRRTRR